MIVALAIRHPARTDGLDRGAEDRIAAHQITPCPFVAVRRQRLLGNAGEHGLPDGARALCWRGTRHHFIAAVSVTRARISMVPAWTGVGAASARATPAIIARGMMTAVSRVSSTLT